MLFIFDVSPGSFRRAHMPVRTLKLTLCFKLDLFKFLWRSLSLIFGWSSFSWHSEHQFMNCLIGCIFENFELCFGKRSIFVWILAWQIWTFKRNDLECYETFLAIGWFHWKEEAVIELGVNQRFSYFCVLRSTFEAYRCLHPALLTCRNYALDGNYLHD